MTNYHHDRNPFVYLVGWTELNAYYLGIYYRKGSKLSDLWTRYFTSSKMVSELREWFGEPDVCEVIGTGTADEVVEWEFNLITQCDLISDPRWLNQNAGGKHFIKKNCSEETKARMSKARKGKPNTNLIGVPRSDQLKRKVSETLKGHEVSEETRSKISQSLKGRPSTISEEQRKAASERRIAYNKSRAGKPLSEEHRRKLSEAMKRSRAERKLSKEDDTLKRQPVSKSLIQNYRH